MFQAILFGLVGIALAIKEPVIIDLVKNPPKEGESVNKLIKVDYSFETESVVYDDIENKDKTPSTLLSGNFSFETLHYDQQGNILARFQMTACRSGPCDMTIPDVFVAFVQGGNNIMHVFIDTKNGSIAPSWNFLFAMANTIYTPALNGEGDDQTLDTVYGRCRVQFGRPENKKFRRIIDGCEIGKKEDNYTRIEYQDYFHFNQDVWYTQNTKVDADIIIIDAIELLSVRTPFDDRWGFQLESRTHVEITNRTQYYVESLCNSELVADCATKVLGLTKVGDKLYEDVAKGIKKKKELLPLLSKYRDHLFDMGETHTCIQHSSLYSEIFEAARKATPGDWGRAIQAPENEPILPAIANLLGSIGSVDSLEIFREVLLPQGHEFLDDYLFGAAHATTNDEKWHKQLIYWLAKVEKELEAHLIEDRQTYWKIANTMATILRKRCERTTSSQNACAKGKDRLVEKFIEDLTVCNTARCTVKALEVLQNLPLVQVYQKAKGYLCSPHHSEEVESAALRLISILPSHLYDSQLIHPLIKLFRDTCPRKTSIIDAHLAVDILSNCVLEFQNAATLILRSETNNPVDHERWQYFYSKITASGARNELNEEFWKKMRAFKVFRPNYAQRSLIADSYAHYDSIGEMGEFHFQKEVASHSEGNHYRGSDLSLFVKKGRKTYNLFGINFWSNGALPGLSSRSSHSAGARLTILDHSLPVNHLYSDKIGMQDRIFEADGQTIKAFHGNIPLRYADVTFPLLSGASVDFFSRGAATFSVFSSVGVSVEKKEVTAEISANISVAFSSEANLVFNGKSQRVVGSELSAVVSYGAGAEAIVHEENDHVCQTMQRKDLLLSLDTYQTDSSRRLRRKRLPGNTFKGHKKSTKQCNDHLSVFEHLSQLRVPPELL